MDIKNIKLLSLHMINFKGFKDRKVEFSTKTKIKGMNGLGKSTMACAYMWLFHNFSYDLSSNPKVRREVDKIPVEGEVSVTAELTIDGKEVVAKKVQKRKFSKKEKDDSYADENTYFINDVPKTLRDFNEYFGFDMTVFLLCSNVNKFLSQKSKEMREFLFGLVDDITDLDIARKFSELSGLVGLLEKYTLAEITAMNKASKTKLDKQLSEIDPRIDQLQKSIVEVDFAERELQLSALKEQLAEVEGKITDTSKSYEEVNRLKGEIAEIKGKMFDIERTEKQSLEDKRYKAAVKIEDVIRQSKPTEHSYNMAIADIGSKKKDIQRNTELLAETRRKYSTANMDLGIIESRQFDENSLYCGSCKQLLPTDNQEVIRSNFEVGKKKDVEEKEADIQAIVEKGNLLNSEIEKDKADIIDIEKKLTEYEVAKSDLEVQLSDAKAELEKLPSDVNLLEVYDYLNLNMTLGILLKKLENAETATESIDTLKQSLLDSKVSIQSEIETTQRLLGASDSNNRAEATIIELQENRKQLSQSVANCERILSLIDLLDRKKNELLVDEINSKFSIVKWVLYEFNKGGTYQPTCIPTVDGFLFGDTTNEGREIAAKIDICQSIQKLKNINCPIFLDRAESINDFNIPEVDCQMVLLSVSDDKEMVVTNGD